ncbi:hypothetical protein DMH04_52195 [Kibdelosporangium aridum]|uniref:Uncharacterized protein n=1 Tax=Kibdelosporangium aridum TaxID=2030 RepID=A0A428Y8I6_KIBAR|nr:hypothetical protein [Kibdelosporangium aridum]RSM63889.1 hypothetical protein DMH04_52195 [Kibdelosporangium aridum]
MNETEELIKAALAKHVERTPHAGPILTALSRRRRRVRPSLIAIIAATVVAAGVAIPIAIQRPEASAPPATQQPMPVESKGIKMRYGLKALPGFVEANRTAAIDGSNQVRTWMKNTCQAGTPAQQCTQSLSLIMYTARHPYWADVIAPKGAHPVRNVDTPGWATWDSQNKQAKLTWRPPEQDTVLMVSLHDSEGDATRKVFDLARTVAVEDSAVVQPPLSFGWLPAELTRTSVTIAGSSPSTAETWIDAETTDPRGREVQAKIVAKAIDSPENHTLAVTLPDGRQVQLMASGNAPLPLDQLRKIAENLKPEPAPDKSWIGR